MRFNTMRIFATMLMGSVPSVEATRPGTADEAPLVVDRRYCPFRPDVRGAAVVSPLPRTTDSGGHRRSLARRVSRGFAALFGRLPPPRRDREKTQDRAGPRRDLPGGSVEGSPPIEVDLREQRPLLPRR